MKYQVVTFFNFFIGFFGAVLALTHFSVRPKIQEMYSDFGNQVPSNFLFPIWAVIVLTIVNFYFGSRLISKKSKLKNKYFIAVVLVTVVSFFLMGALSQSLVITTIGPIYDLTNQF